MKTLSLCLCVLLSACSDFNFNTDYGMTVFPAVELNLTVEEVNSSTAQWIDAAVQATVGNFNWTEQELAGAINHSTMVIEAEPLKCNIRKADGALITKCDGLYWPDLKQIKLGFYPGTPFCQTAFWDELTHMAFEEIEAVYFSGAQMHEQEKINAIFSAIRSVPCYDVEPIDEKV